MSDAQLGRIEQYLKRVADALERIEKNTRPPATTFVDVTAPTRIQEWGPTH